MVNAIPSLIGFSEKNGQWFAEGISLSKLTQDFGTPLYVYSKEAICSAYRAYDSACIRPDGTRRARIHYAMKANSNLAVLDELKQLGAGFDLVSGGELARALHIGADPKSLVFAGVGKSSAEIENALRVGVKCINVESIPELQRINVIAKTMSLREVLKTYREAALLPQIDVIGIDCHIGSQITSASPYLDALDKVLDLITQLQREGIKIHHLDLGGGLGIDYGGESPPNITEFTNTLLNRVEERGFGHLEVLLEPGRSLVGNAGILLTQVEYLKTGVDKNFCIVNAAMNDLMRPALYEAYHAIVPIHVSQAKPNCYDVVGPVCESGDWLGKDRVLAVNEGDILAILSAGAYGFVMASNYNTRGRAAEVMVDGNEAYLVRQRETPESLYENERTINQASALK